MYKRHIQVGLSIAKFPVVRTLDGFEFEAQPSAAPKLVRELAWRGEGPKSTTDIA